MPLPERYVKEVLDVHKIWKPEGSFRYQGEFWVAQATARHERDGKPSKRALGQLRKGLDLTPEEIDFLNEPTGHETNRYLGVVRSHVPPEAANEYHKGNTSSDPLDTATSMQMRESIKILDSDFSDLVDITGKLALRYRTVRQVGRSHGQQALPKTAGREFLGWHAELKRCVGRLRYAHEVIGVGKSSGEIGTHVFIDPEIEDRALEILGLKSDEAPTQVISRDRHAEVVSLLAVNAGTLERIATNIRLSAISEVDELREPTDAGGVHSSSMPHKNNPEKCERVCGIAKVIRGAALDELQTQALWWDRDISHSSVERFVFPDAFEGLAYAARIMKGVLKDLVVNEEQMLKNLNAKYGAIYSPGLMNALIDVGMQRDVAYKQAQALAKQAMREKVSMYDLVLKNKEIVSTLGMDVINRLFDPDFYLRNIDVAYRRVGLSG